MGEEGVVLEDVAALAGAGRDVDGGGGVEEDAAIEEDAAFGGADEAGEAIEGEGFAGSAGAEEDGDAGGGAEIDMESETGGAGAGRETLVDAGFEHGAGFSIVRWGGGSRLRRRGGWRG